jgi:hypothetical protein
MALPPWHLSHFEAPSSARVLSLPQPPAVGKVAVFPHEAGHWAQMLWHAQSQANVSSKCLKILVCTPSPACLLTQCREEKEGCARSKGQGGPWEAWN